MPSTLEVTASDGARLHVVDQRAPDEAADVVVWLQGLNAPAAAWAVQLAHFSRTHRCIAPDPRGVGKSDAPPGPYSTAQMADDVRRILDACGVERAHLVGLSLGGAVAQEVALAHPSRVRSIALLASFARQSARSRALMESWRTLYPLAAQSQAFRDAWEKQAYAWLFTDAYWRNDAAMRAALRFAATQPLQPVDGFLGQIDAALAHDSVARLPSLRVRTLIVHGALDQLAAPAGAEEMARLIPGAELLVLPEVGHAVNLEGQRAVNAALRAFWRKL
ncbi:MAG TPA: alpha/beta hydrolase [Myxococcales bacterium]|nr:alpha/beta hydrolase [Myxococcales bacterium]